MSSCGRWFHPKIYNSLFLVRVVMSRDSRGGGVVLLGVLVLVVVLVACSPGVVCSPPYIRYGTGCCLDQNGNKICDSDERGSAGAANVSAATTKAVDANPCNDSVGGALQPVPNPETGAQFKSYDEFHRFEMNFLVQRGNVTATQAFSDMTKEQVLQSLQMFEKPDGLYTCAYPVR
jgi:hypothetical protein